MYVLRKLQIPGMAHRRIIAVLILILLPFPVGIPLALWLRDHRSLSGARGPLPSFSDRSIPTIISVPPGRSSSFEAERPQVQGKPYRESL